MAMLAEPRRKKRYILQPRKALYEDDSRFGTKMLEKMGWTKGKGLGVNEDGNKEFLRVNYKNDVKGVGFEDRDDQWKQHEHSFNGFLKQLNGDDDAEAGAETTAKEINRDDVEEMPRVGFGFAADPARPLKGNKHEKKKLKEKISGVSLEEISKRSRARVHYKKFTKGKDLSQYTETDLANIFGRKADSEEQPQEETSGSNLYNGFAATEIEESGLKGETAKKNDEVVVTKMGGVQMITTGVSINDYFKQKMLALKNKTNQSKTENFDAEKNEGTRNDSQKTTQLDENAAEVELKQKKSKKKKKENFCGVAEELEVKAESEPADVEVEQKEQSFEEAPKKKSKKKKNNEENEDSTNNGDKTPPLDEAEMVRESSIILPTTEPALNDADAGTTKKKMKRKNEKEAESVQSKQKNPQETVQSNVTELSTTATKQKRRKDKKNSSTENFQTEPQTKETPKRVSSLSKKREGNDDEAAQQLLSPSKRKPLTPEELDKKIASLNVLSISSFVAEKFRLVDLDRFVGSNLLNIPGYGLSEDVKLEVHTSKNDEQRILQFWSSTLTKYDTTKPGAKYDKYRKDLRTARKAKQRIPRLKVKAFKRRNAFQGVKI